MENAVRRPPVRADPPAGHSRATRYRLVAAPFLDAVSWSFSLIVAAVLRDGSATPAHFWSRAALIVGLAVAAQLTVGFSTDLYRGRWRVGSLEEAAVLVRAVLVVTVVLVVTDLLMAVNPLPVSAVVAGGALTLLLAGGGRSLWRISLSGRPVRRPAPRSVRRRLGGR